MLKLENLQFKTQFQEITLFFLDAGKFQNTQYLLQVIEINYKFRFSRGFSNLYRKSTTL